MTSGEKFIHFSQSIRQLNSAWTILREIKRSEGNLLIAPAFQFALVEYSKPYKISYGKSRRDKYSLDDRYVPEQHRELHRRILTLRDQVHAHGDLGVLDACLYVSSTPTGQLATIGQNIIYGTELLPEIDAIIDLIEGQLAQMYLAERKLEAQLPTTDSGL